MKSEDVIPLSRVKVHIRCPKCGSAKIEKSATSQSDRSSNGSSLWAVIARCIMCAWVYSVSNVKVGL